MFNNGKAGIHGAEQLHGLRGGGRLVSRQLPEIAVHKTHQGKSAEGDDFPRIFTGKGQVVSEWLAHVYAITRAVTLCKQVKETVPLFLSESGTGEIAISTPYTPAGTAAGAAGDTAGAAGATAGATG